MYITIHDKESKNMKITNLSRRLCTTEPLCYTTYSNYKEEEKIPS